MSWKNSEFMEFIAHCLWMECYIFINMCQYPILKQGRVTQKLSSRGKYVSVNIGPVQVVSSEQVFLSLSLSCTWICTYTHGYAHTHAYQLSPLHLCCLFFLNHNHGSFLVQAQMAKLYLNLLTFNADQEHTAKTKLQKLPT